MRQSGQALTTARMCVPRIMHCPHNRNNTYTMITTHIHHHQSFFTIYRNLFTRLAQEENLISQIEYPSFGDAFWPWSTPKSTNTPAARNFYNAWLNFATLKDFVWTEQWNLSEAPDRRVRR